MYINDPVLSSLKMEGISLLFTLAFALQLRKEHGKISVRLRKTSVRVYN
jgi:hypothetical protein